MAYGLTLEQVRHINRPRPTELPWGTTTCCTEMEEYSLARLELKPGAAEPLHFHPVGGRHAFVEHGEVLVRRLDKTGRASAAVVRPGTTLPLAPFEVHGFSSRTGAEIYLFGPPGSGPEAVLVETAEDAQHAVALAANNPLPEVGQATTDRLEKYWGAIETIFSGDVAGKRIFVSKGGQSSLEFHVEKRETYWIHAGLLKVGLRIGRAENHSIVLRPGESYDIRPGVMHMRIALEDTVIIEASTRDSDADSHLVEDGQTYRHIEASAP
ncbi:MAG TPA: hypothetical protein VJX94_22860 [Stellaceae bacterium]|nr:hypothetical protein [Stellaceae bacterium]